jgi:hypothetical protein
VYDRDHEFHGIIDRFGRYQETPALPAHRN